MSQPYSTLEDHDAPISKPKHTGIISRFTGMTRDSVPLELSRHAVRADFACFLFNVLYSVLLLFVAVQSTMLLHTGFNTMVRVSEASFIVCCLPFAAISAFDVVAAVDGMGSRLYISPVYGIALRGLPVIPLTLLALFVVVDLFNIEPTLIAGMRLIGTPQLLIFTCVATQLFCTSLYVPLFIQVKDRLKTSRIGRLANVIYRVMFVHRVHGHLPYRMKVIIHVADLLIIFAVAQIPFSLLASTASHVRLISEVIADNVSADTLEIVQAVLTRTMTEHLGSYIQLSVQAFFLSIGVICSVCTLPIHSHALANFHIKSSTGQAVPHDRPRSMADILAFLSGWWRELDVMIKFMFHVERPGTARASVYEV